MHITFKVLTYNIHKGFSPGRLRFMLPQMRRALEAINSDMVFLQEVRGEHKRDSVNQFEFLADQLWPHYAYGKNAIYQAGHHGNAILSKFPFVGWENINVARIPRSSRSILHGIIKVADSDTTVHVLCIHLGLFKTERSGQIDQLCDRIAETIPADEALIIAGDFNDWRREAWERLEAEFGLREVFKELTGKYAKSFPALRPTLATDRIYYRGLKLLEGQCLKKLPWRVLSDHLPLLATFKIV